MEYIIKHCPECNGELHVPKEIKTCICMYCGKTIDLSENKGKIKQETPQNIAAEYNKAIGRSLELVGEYDRYLKNFTKSNYSTSFEEYVELGRSVLLPMERYAAVSESNKEEVIASAANGLIIGIDNLIAEKSKGFLKNKGDILHQYRYFLAVYTIPMIRYLNLAISEQLVDTILEIWCATFPDYIFYKADYNELLAGFNRKGFCFITTAVCDVLGKEDQCDELTAFRGFRDGFMMSSEENRELVEEYYQIAPSIVALINTTPGSKEKYLQLWQDYLQPCLEDIDNNRPEECRIKYLSMMTNLKMNYMK